MIFVDDFLRISSLALLLNDDRLFVVQERSSVLADLTGSLLFLRWSIRRCLVWRNDNEEESNGSIESFCSDDKSELKDGDVTTTIVGLNGSEFERLSTAVWVSKRFSLSVSRVSDEKLFDRWVFTGDNGCLNVTCSNSSIGFWGVGTSSGDELLKKNTFF